MKKTQETRLKELFSKYSAPPLDVIIPMLEKTGQREQDLFKQLYDTYANLAQEIRKILELESGSMKTLVKVWGIICGFEGIKIQPVEMSDSRVSYSLSDCPMLHVGKDISLSVKGRFCDVYCTSASKALVDTLIGSRWGVVSWDKALIKGAAKCTVVFESSRDT